MTTQDAGVPELLACPFCGERPTMHENDWCEPPEFIVMCGCRPLVFTAKEAAEAWNRRADIRPAKVAAVISAVADLIDNSPIGDDDRPYISETAGSEFDRLVAAFNSMKGKENERN